MRKIIFYLLLSLSLSFQLAAQDCPQATLYLSTQSQIDSFSILYPNCTEMDAGLFINGGTNSDISSLSALSQLTSIGGQFTIESNDLLVNLDGLHNLTSVDGLLFIRLNDGLTDMSALNNLTSVQGIEISSNNSLTSIEGFLSTPISLSYLKIYYNDGLQTINGFEGITDITSDLKISDNNLLANIEGFNGLTTVGTDLFIKLDSMLTTLSGFNNLNEIGRDFKLTKTNLTNNTAFGNLNTVGRDIEIVDNPLLISLDGLIPLNGLGQNLRLDNNAKLTDVQALSNLTTVPRAFSIIDNNSLTNISGASNIQQVMFLSITGNELLTDLSGFQSLDTIEMSLAMYGNGTIPDLTGFSSLTSVKSINLGNPSFANSSGVQSLNGLQGLTTLPFLLVTNSSSLSSLQGLENVTSMTNLSLWGVSPLTNLTGLESLETIDQLLITFCYDLQSLEGLNSLETVTDVLLISGSDQLTNLTGLDNLQSVDRLQINVNEGLTSLNGIESLQNVDSLLRINLNNNLIDISGIQNANIDDLGLLKITANPLLSVCNYNNICNYLTAGGTSSISGNNTGCGNQAEVFDACLSGLDHTRLQGNIWADLDLDCAQSTGDESIPKVLMYIQGDTYNYTFTTDSAGFYDVPVLAGDYYLTVLSISSFWTACDASFLMTTSGMNDTLVTDFFLQPQGDCSYIDWTMNLNGLRICGTRGATIDLCNYGVQTAENVLVTIDLGDFVTIDSASVNYTTNADGTILIALDSLEIFECTTIDFNLFTDCDSVEINDMLCLDVSLMTDDICAPDSLWDGSNTSVTGSCDGDSIYFQIENIGAGDMLSPANFKAQILIEDIVLLFEEGDYQLQSGDILQLSYPTIGTGFYMEVDQTVGNPIPGNATASVPNCDALLNGMSNLFPNNNGNPISGVFCTVAANSFDPNIKSAIPIGTGEEHFIANDWKLNYTIQFQNTGNDVAYEVVIKDTISNHLDLNTLKIHGASHAFTWTLSEDRELVFTFANILLADSTSNEPASHGMVSYSIYPQQDLTPLTRIENRAGIYFDFNDPIITNTVFHTIRKPVYSTIEYLDWCAGTQFNGVAINQDTTIIQLIEYVEFDSVLLSFLHVVDTLNVVEMVDVPVGDYFENIEINNDTTFSIYHSSALGCDSIVTYHITAFTVNVNEVDNSLQEVLVFPNPANELLFIDASKMTEIQSYTLTNTLGLLVWEKTIAPFQSLESISLRKIPTGVYYLEGKSDAGRRVWKVVVSHP